MDFFSLYTMLPFMLVLAVVYGGLESIGMFRNRALKAIISVVMAFFAVSNQYIVDTINSYLPYAAIVFIVVFVIGFAKKSLSGGGRDNELIVIIMALFLLFIASNFTQSGLMYQYNEFLWLIGVAVVAAIFYAAYKTKEN